MPQNRDFGPVLALLGLRMSFFQDFGDGKSGPLPPSPRLRRINSGRCAMRLAHEPDRTDSGGNARTSVGRAARIRAMPTGIMALRRLAAIRARRTKRRVRLATPSAWLTRAIAGMGRHRRLRSRHPAGGGRWGGFVGHGGRAWCERQRFRKVLFTTCLGKVVVRCREGLGGDAPRLQQQPDQKPAKMNCPVGGCFAIA